MSGRHQIDPFGDSTFLARDGQEIRAANGRDLWRSNLSAPRMLSSIAGSFAVSVTCLRASRDRPYIGGLLLWKGERNYVRLDVGIRGPGELSLEGCIGNQDFVFGRGRLDTEPVHLRLEKRGSQVCGLCSADGNEWFLVGRCRLEVPDPVRIGLHAIGKFDRTVYHGAFARGTAIRFQSMYIWGGRPTADRQSSAKR